MLNDQVLRELCAVMGLGGVNVQMHICNHENAH